MILLLRVLPFLVGLLQVIVFWYQSHQPETYPWIVGIGWIAVPLAAVAVSWGHIALRDLMHRMAPTFVTIACLSFGLLLVEGPWQFGLVTALASLISFISLELLFLQSYDLVAYPVHGISRVNVGYVPIAVWYAASTSIGLMTFLHSDAVWHVALMATLGAILFRTTGHPDATRPQERMWTALGAMVGAEVGLLGIFLPIGMQPQGLFAAVMFSAALRMRRYLYEPRPSMKVAYVEGIVAFVVFVVTLATSKWI